MCGIAGILSGRALTAERERGVMDALRHRGPDGCGVWADDRVVLVHTRLAIRDLSSAAAQPMQRGTHVCVFNGEIYNANDLRKQLEADGESFATTSDTEVLLLGFTKYGDRWIRELRGMFAAAVWDGHQLHLFRDPFGMKPLYICTMADGAFAFASEIKGLLALGADLTLRPQAVLEYLLLNNTLGEETFAKQVRQLEPGTLLCVEAEGRRASSRYWAAPFNKPRAPKEELGDVLQAVEESVEKSIERHLVSDVPVGILLSGGIDSSLVAAGAARLGANIASFTLDCQSEGGAMYAQFAACLAKRFGFRHQNVTLRSADLEDALMRTARLADEPHGDAAELGVYQLCNHSRAAGCKVVLTGDGGDELFGGYKRHSIALLARRFGFGLIDHSRFTKWLPPVQRRRVDIALSPPHLRYPALLMSCATPSAVGDQLLAPDLRADTDFRGIVRALTPCIDTKSYLSSILATDVKTILKDSYLRKTDRAGMYAGVEGRLPLLDQDLAELAFGLPESALIRRGVGKMALRRLLGRWAPDAMTMAPKMGFAVPYRDWLKHPRLIQLRGDLASSCRFRGLITEQGARLLRGTAQNSADASLQWRLLRLAMWSDTWGAKFAC